MNVNPEAKSPTCGSIRSPPAMRTISSGYVRPGPAAYIGAGKAPPKRVLTSVMPSPISRSRKACTVHGPRTGSASPTARPSSTSSGSGITVPLIDSPPRDSIMVLGIAFRQRPSRSQSRSIENSGPCISRWTMTGSSTYRTKKSFCSRSAAGWIERAPDPRRGLTITGYESGSSSGRHVGGLASPCRSSSSWVSNLS